MISLLSPGKAPLDLAGASRSTVIIRRNHRRLERMSFSCSRDTVSSYPRRNISEDLEAVFRLAISFRRSLINHAHIKAWSKRHEVPNFPVPGA